MTSEFGDLFQPCEEQDKASGFTAKGVLNGLWVFFVYPRISYCKASLKVMRARKDDFASPSSCQTVGAVAGRLQKWMPKGNGFYCYDTKEIEGCFRRKAECDEAVHRLEAIGIEGAQCTHQATAFVVQLGPTEVGARPSCDDEFCEVAY